jgi:plasmid stabilization system protein ParE
LAPGLRSALARPYTIFYRVQTDEVEIVRVLHERRDFPAIFSGRDR